MPWEEETEDSKTSVWDTVSSMASTVTGVLAPPALRRRVKNASRTLVSYTGTGLTYAGKTAWVVATAALVLLFPLALEADREQQLLEMEQEAMRAQGLVPPQ